MSTQVKGAVLLSRIAFVRSEFGDAAWQRVLASLSSATRTTLERSILSSGWYPFDVNKELDEAVVKVVGRGNRDVFKRIGARSAEENLTGPHRAFLTPGRPDLFMAKTAQVYRFYYDVGERTFEPTGPTSGVMTTVGAETYAENDCLTVVGWYEHALAMCGAKTVEVEEVTCRARGGPHCRYRVAWTV